jgi:single-strand DNA-binding protein
MRAFGLARVGRDAELRHTADGQSVANVSLAFSYGRKGADGKRPTTWVDGALWGKQAEALTQYLVKGQQVAVSLEDVHIETFERQDGTSSSKLVARIAGLDFAGSASKSEAPAPKPAPAPPPKPAKNNFDDDIDSDIPF